MITILYFTEQNIDKTTMLGEAIFIDNKLDVIYYDENYGDCYYNIGHGSMFGDLHCYRGDSLDKFIEVCESMCNIIYAITDINTK